MPYLYVLRFIRNPFKVDQKALISMFSVPLWLNNF